MQSRFIVLGMASGGLFLARQLRKESPGSLIYAIGDAKCEIGRYSRVIDRFYSVESSDSLPSIIRQAYDDIGQGFVKAYLCSNQMLEAIVLRYKGVFDYLSFDNSIDVYNRLVDKTEVEVFCKELKINRPVTYSLSESKLDEIKYPVVIKPLEKSLTKGASKCAFISDKDKMKAYLDKIEALCISRSNLICQQSIEGDNRWEYGYGGFFLNGSPIVDICFYQFRQAPQGLCCYTREITDVELQRRIVNLVRPILDSTKYSGMIEFDIKQDENARELFLLDINPRPWRSSEMLQTKLNKSTVFSPKMDDRIAIWRYPYRELFSWKNKKNVSYSVCRSLTKDHPSRTQTFLFDRKDFFPFLIQVKNDFLSLLNSAFKK